MATKPGEKREKGKAISRVFHAKSAAEAFADQALKTQLYGMVWVRDEVGVDYL
jgi:hypothetical protein